MRRPRVICELTHYLGILLRSGLRGEEGDASLGLLESAPEIEREGPTPAFFLSLYRVDPDLRPARAFAPGEPTEGAAAGLRLELRRPPVWIACRYLVGVRGRASDEEAEMIVAAFRTLHDHPTVSAEHLPSIRSRGLADRFAIEVLADGTSWREAGLSRPRLTVAFRVTVPIPSALSDPVDRVLDREILIEELR